MIREIDDTSTGVPTTPLARHVTPRYELPPSLSGAIVLIDGILALELALYFIGTATEAQAVLWAFFVAGVIAALYQWT